MNIVINNRKSTLQRLLQTHQTMSVMGMPGSGISLFLKEMSKSDLGYPVYVDVFGLSELSTPSLLHELSRQLGITQHAASNNDLTLACISRLGSLARKHKRIIIYFAGFDQLIKSLDAEMLQHLQAIARSCNGSVRLIFGLCISLKKLIPDEIFDSGLRLFGNIYYLGRYTDEELLYLLQTYVPNLSRKDMKTQLQAAGGHFQLLLALLEQRSAITDTKPDTASLLFKNLYEQLLKPQRTIIRKVAQTHTLPVADEYLLGIGMISKANKGYELFSPLFANYLLQMQAKRLPLKERRLFLLLKKNTNQTVSKQEIIKVVWNDEIISDWALNALVYRLRKHPAFLAKNYTIENHKKLGYVLSKNF